jgi:hypothetical protein
MASYFRQVPNFDYISRNKEEKYISEYIPVKNLFKRGKLREDIFQNLQFFEKYKIIGNERPDNVAYKLYDDETLDWVVLLSNNILNIQSEWPLSQRGFDKVMLEKYRTIDITNMDFIAESQIDKDEIERSRSYNDDSAYAVLYSGIHHYETTEIKNSLGVTVLKSGIEISPSWKTNGNFLEIINSQIAFISSFVNEQSTVPSATVFVAMINGILGLNIGDQVTIDNVSDRQYAGQHIVSNITDIQNNIVYQFQYELPFIPNDLNPTMANPRKEEVHYTISEQSLNPGNSYYYEYWDPGLGYSVQVPSTSFVRPVTNYEYENLLEEEKRNIYVLKPRYLNVVFNDMDTIMPYKKGSQQYVSETLKRGDNIRLYQ